MIRNSEPYAFQGLTLADVQDATLANTPGACLQLSNILLSVENPGCWYPRAANSLLTDFTGANGPTAPIGKVSVAFVDGTRIYGLVASGKTNGSDEPFCYDTATSAFVAISYNGGYSSTHVPVSPTSTQMDSTPPVIDKVGTMVIVTHPNAPGGAGDYFYWIDVSVPNTPTWFSGNTTTKVLKSPPISVIQFNDRAYFVCSEPPAAAAQGTVYRYINYTDVLTNPPTITNATQSLTIGDNTAITALGGLPVTQTSGGILQAFFAFKAFQTVQITGDGTTLAKNTAGFSTGTKYPRSLATTPVGLIFLSPDGMRHVDFTALITPAGNVLRAPFVNLAIPYAQVAASYSMGTYRVCVNTQTFGGGQKDFWLDLDQQSWSGPHTFPYDWIAPLKLGWVLHNPNVTGLWYSTKFPTNIDTYVENGTQLVYTLQTSPMPDVQPMSKKCVIETQVEIACVQVSATINFQFQDEKQITLNQTSVSVNVVTSLWGAGIWGVTPWNGSSIPLQPITLPWSKPLVFNRGSLIATGKSSIGLQIGSIKMRYQPLRYMG